MVGAVTGMKFVFQKGNSAQNTVIGAVAGMNCVFILFYRKVAQHTTLCLVLKLGMKFFQEGCSTHNTVLGAVAGMKF